MEDYSGASAMVYAINAQHQPTLQVLLDACRAKGRDIIIITTEMGVSGGPVTRRYLNVLPFPMHHLSPACHPLTSSSRRAHPTHLRERMCSISEDQVRGGVAAAAGSPHVS
ncbi:hypothetical protein J4Q44_G00046730 [Coregonus suidteri]|uniref:Uncharacterized protein n=1 Tax=Coregonus suidteri TaxID=861788 RepID=A0AAN8MF99_9TELE